MKISTKGRYALRMLIDLALHQNEGYISLKDISERQDISKKYLEQIVPMLNRNGILRTNRGNHGGYMLAKAPSACTVGAVLRATEGNLAPVSCLDTPVNDCPRAGNCPTLFIWEGLNRAVSEYLDSITLQDILDRSAPNSGDLYCI
ncbi:MAG: Rrf2 family transcriptional regulator [Oscillospiraceae bacterium]|nr:Rrf2 family transcriptional regulator [Oscillospiraceae bacterium]MCR5305169.1 Rrf2 family transcriptional regulator [Oscillospiraceae bacterium]